MLRRVAVFSIGGALALQSSLAAADPAAEALFREARTLLEEGKVNAACEKFEASKALEPSSGTLLNLGACRLEQGRTATAWAYFAEAARSARAQNRPAHEKEAEQRKADVEPELSYLKIVVTEEVPGLKVVWNGREVEMAGLGSELPGDPGPIVVEASAPGYESVKLELTLGQARDHRVVTIPKLRRQTSPETREATGSSSSDASFSTHVPDKPSPLPWVVGGLGATALLTGGVFGVLALSSDAEAKRLCDQKTSNCPRSALEAQDRRDTQALVSTIGVGVGLVGVGIAGILLLATPTTESHAAVSWGASADLGPDHALLQVQSRF